MLTAFSSRRSPKFELALLAAGYRRMLDFAAWCEVAVWAQKTGAEGFCQLRNARYRWWGRERFWQLLPSPSSWDFLAQSISLCAVRRLGSRILWAKTGPARNRP